MNIDDYLNFKNDFSKFNDKVKINNIKLEKGDILYLKGKIFTQIYSPVRSSETRLFIRKYNNKYRIKISLPKRYRKPRRKLLKEKPNFKKIKRHE